MAGQIERGEIRLFELKKPDKPRPVLVLTRGSAIRYLSRVTIAPITSTVRGVPSEVMLDTEDGMKRPCAVNLHNLITVSQDDLGRRLTELRPAKIVEVCAAIQFALGCDSEPSKLA